MTRRSSASALATKPAPAGPVRESLPTAQLAGMAAGYNPRTISDREIDALRRSLRHFGAVEPIVVNRRTNRIVGGHQRVRAAELEGIAELPVVHVDLDDAGERQLNLALNRIHGEWDGEKLAAVFRELQAAGADLTLSGFDAGEIEKLAQAALETLANVNERPVPALPANPTTRPGDVIELGAHRLVCGDSTETDPRLRATDGETADAMWTDPPYGVEYEGGTEAKLRIRNDAPGDIPRLLRGALANADVALAPGAAIYIAHPAGAIAHEFYRAVDAIGWQLRQTLVWVKDQLVLGHADYHYRHEPILYASKPGFGRRGRGARGWFGGNAETTVFEIAKPRSSNEHPTSKPVELVARMLRNSTQQGSLVYDPFAGSGSTVMASELLGRRCAAIEIDPAYCDVIVQRWEAFAGKKAKRPRRSR